MTRSTATAFAKLIAEAFEYGVTHCTVPKILLTASPLSSLGITYHTLITIIAGVTTILCIIVSLCLSLGHWLNWVNPPEQKQIVRIILCLPIFAFFNWFCVWSYRAAGFLVPIPQIYEAFAIIALFYLYVVYISPDESNRERFFDGLERRTRGGKAKHENGSLRWFHMIWILIFQLLLGRIATTIAMEYVEARFCPLSTKLRRSQTVVTLVQSVDTAVAVLAVIRFELRMKDELKGHHALLKLVMFKGVIFIDLVQASLFRILASTHAFTPTEHVTYFDFALGTPAFMTCCEMFIFSVLFIWAFSFSPYKAARQGGAHKHSVGRAIVDVFNITDILQGFTFMFRAMSRKSFGKRYVNEEKELGYSSNEQSPDSMMDKPVYVEAPTQAHINAPVNPSSGM